MQPKKKTSSNVQNILNKVSKSTKRSKVEKLLLEPFIDPETDKLNAGIWKETTLPAFLPNISNNCKNIVPFGIWKIVAYYG